MKHMNFWSYVTLFNDNINTIIIIIINKKLEVVSNTC
jgi:hypothetical protein